MNIHLLFLYVLSHYTMFIFENLFELMIQRFSCLTFFLSQSKIFLMRNEIRQQLADSIKDFRLPRYKELPTVGLYLEQTINYINSFLIPLGCMEMTPSMVSNYVKKGLIDNPVKKQYSAEQIAYLFFIAIAKNVTSIENIYQLHQMQKKSYTAPVAYDYLCDELENMLFYVFGLKDNIDDIGVTSSKEKTMLRSVIIAASHIIYLNHCFSAFDSYPKEES